MTNTQSFPSFYTSNHKARRFIHAAFWIFIGLGVLFWFGQLDVPGHDDEWMLAYLSVASAFVLLLPWWLSRSIQRIKKRINEHWLAVMEVMLLLAMSASWIGAFGLYRAGFEYDSGVHVLASFLGVVMAALLLSALISDMKRHRLFLLSTAAMLALFAGVGNELVEWASDAFFGTQMYGEIGQPDDTFRDMIANMVGVLVGVVFVYSYHSRLLHKFLRK